MDFSKLEKVSIGGIELKELLINGIQVWKAASYINQIRVSTDANGNTYNVKGWKENTYVSGSGDAAKTGYESTGFIPCKVGDVVRLKNVAFKKGDANCSISFYSSKGNSRINLVQANSSWYMDTKFAGVVDSGNNYTQFTIANISGYTTGTAFIRITASTIDSTSVITINQEIK